MKKQVVVKKPGTGNYMANGCLPKLVEGGTIYRYPIPKPVEGRNSAAYRAQMAFCRALEQAVMRIKGGKVNAVDGKKISVIAEFLRRANTLNWQIEHKLDFVGNPLTHQQFVDNVKLAASLNERAIRTLESMGLDERSNEDIWKSIYDRGGIQVYDGTPLSAKVVDDTLFQGGGI